jgi:PhzF family phenazine biosynthesis protein
MQRMARWTNLSETTFLLSPAHPDADYRVRIFTSYAELPFAGHPTLGSCHAWLRAGGQAKAGNGARSRIVQECAAGLIGIKADGERLAFAAPPLIKTGPVEADLLARVCQGLQLKASDLVQAAWCDNGPGWMGLVLKSADDVLKIKPLAELLQGLKIGLIGPQPSSAQTDALDPVNFEVRAFFPKDEGIQEDPVTGSLNAAFASWLIPQGLAPARYVASQGSVLGRRGRVYIEQSGGQFWVGGYSKTCISGTIAVPSKN